MWKRIGGAVEPIVLAGLCVGMVALMWWLVAREPEPAKVQVNPATQRRWNAEDYGRYTGQRGYDFGKGVAEGVRERAGADTLAK
jgi:hypothetical protein